MQFHVKFLLLQPKNNTEQTKPLITDSAENNAQYNLK